MGQLFGGSKAGRAHALRQAADQRRHRLGRIGGRPPFGPMTLATALTIAVPTTTPSAEAPITLRLLGGLDAEADADRQVGVALDALHRGGDLGRVGAAPSR